MKPEEMIEAMTNTMKDIEGKRPLMRLFELYVKECNIDVSMTPADFLLLYDEFIQLYHNRFTGL